MICILCEDSRTSVLDLLIKSLILDLTKPPTKRRLRFGCRDLYFGFNHLFSYQQSRRSNSFNNIDSASCPQKTLGAERLGRCLKKSREKRPYRRSSVRVLPPQKSPPDSFQILADSFETRFTPFTLERPRVRTCCSCIPSSTHPAFPVSSTPRKHPFDRVHPRIPCQRRGPRRLLVLWKSCGTS